jgi:hypothetical protein
MLKVGEDASVVDVFPIPKGHYEDDESLILDLADDPVGANAIPPQPGKVANQGLAKTPWTLVCLKPFF